MKKVKITVAVILAAITIFFVGCTAVSTVSTPRLIIAARASFSVLRRPDSQRVRITQQIIRMLRLTMPPQHRLLITSLPKTSRLCAPQQPPRQQLATLRQLELIRKLQPDAKTIGIIYTTSEPNSVSAIAEYKEKAGNYGFTIEAIGVADQASVTQAADTLINKKVDCITNLTDNNVVGVLPSILEKTNAAGIPVYGSEIEQVKKGCVASAGIDYVELGKMAGKLAAQILKGEAKASDLPYETVTEYSTYINSDAASAMGITVPSDVAAKAIECK